MKGAATRELILDTAVELGSLRGLADLSLGGLASEVEMSKSGLFAHFGSKEELQLATVARAWEVFEEEVLLPSPDDGGGSLAKLLERWLSFYERRVFAGGCFFVIAAVELKTQEGAVRDALRTAVDRQIVALESAIIEADQSGELRLRRDAGQLAFELHSTLTNADALFHLHEDPIVFVRARATIGDLLEERRAGA